jgi:glyoxylase-like metal-dependent hydrolase (beta-lactamase superfamily II)
MTVTRIVPHLYQIVVPTPFPVGPINTYFSTDPAGPLTLVDTGPRTDEARAALERGLNTLGYTLADVECIIITHAHSDHYGLAGDIAHVSGASVFSHAHNRPQLEDDGAESAKRGAFYKDELIKAGVPDDVRTTIFRMLGGTRNFASSVSRVHNLDEGDEVQLAGQSWQVLFMPGHTAGLICLYQPEIRLFLSNDHLLRDISSNPIFEPPLRGQTQRRRSLVDYIASLERTAAMSIAITWPGHGDAIYDHRALIEERLAFHHRRADKIIAALQNSPQTVFALSQAIFAKLNPTDFFLAISEVLAHLEWLEERAVVTSDIDNGRVFWRKR